MKRFVVAGTLIGLALGLIAVAALFVDFPGSPGLWEILILMVIIGSVFVLPGAAVGAAVGAVVEFLNRDRRDGE